MLKITIIFILSALFFNTFADDKSQTVLRMIGYVSLKYAPDKRTALFDVEVSEKSGLFVLKGRTNLPEAKQMLLDSISSLKISFSDSVIVLPQSSMGEKTWAIVTLAVSNMRSEPNHAAELVSQALMGTPVKVLETSSGWYHVQTPDLYIGWMEASGVALKTQAEMTLWKQHKRFIFNQIAGLVLNAPNKKASPISDLVLGDVFESISETSKYLQIIFPDGRTGYVKKTDCMAFDKWIARKPDVDAVINIAKQMMGSAYVWGGTSCKGVDCSGMVKIAWFSQGVILARDASQQARYGNPIDLNNLDQLEKGDLLFFGKSAQRITHVGLYMGNGLYVHSSGMVRINSIDPKDPLFNITERKRIVAATRILNAVNSEGIVGIKEHPWYFPQ